MTADRKSGSRRTVGRKCGAI